MKNILIEKRAHIENHYWAGIKSYTTPENAQFPLHCHEFIELIYGLSGEYSFTVDNQVYSFGPGDLLIINSWQSHEKKLISKPEGVYLLISINPAMIYSSFFDPSELYYSLPFVFPGLIDSRIVKPVEIKDVFDRFIEELRNKEYGWELAVKSYIFQIILWITRNVATPFQNRGAYSENVLNCIGHAFAYIANHYQEHLSVREIADHCHIDYSYFSKVFKEITQKSCTEYINFFRIQKAEALLLTTNLSITEISSQIGFDNVSYFIKQFRKFKGSSPKQYQLSLNKRHSDEEN